MSREHKHLALLLVVTVLAFARLWFVQFSWDDEALIVDNQLTGSLGNVADFFTHDLWSTTRLPWLKSGYYRPLMLLSLAMDRSLFGLSSAAAHVHSLLWHLLAVAMLYALLRRLVDAGPALAGATLFALHPVQSEVLALVAGRNDSMAAAFALMSLWLLADRRVTPWRLAAASLALLAGLLSKESAVLVPVMLLALDLARWRRPGALSRYAVTLLSVGVYWGLRFLAGVDEAILPAASSITLVARHALDIAAVYARMLVWPWPLTPARHVHYLPALSESLWGLVLLGGLLAWALIKGRHRALVLVGLAWAVLAFLPTLAATLDKGLLGERYLYLPLAGLGLALAAALQRLPRWLVPGFALLSITVLQLRLPDWQDSRTVWEAAHRVRPTPFTAGGLAWYLHRDWQRGGDAQDLAQARELFHQALAGDPPYRDVCDMIVMADLEARQPAVAVQTARWALNERGCPARGLIIDQTAIALAGSGRWQEAEAMALKQPGGARGPGLIAIGAARAARGDLKTTLALARKTKDPGYLKRVARLLTLAGATEAADQVLKLGAPPSPPSP